jgi:hypothetical protein
MFIRIENKAAKAGNQCFQIFLDACLRRHDGISEFLRVCQLLNQPINESASQPFRHPL